MIESITSCPNCNSNFSFYAIEDGPTYIECPYCTTALVIDEGYVYIHKESPSQPRSDVKKNIIICLVAGCIIMGFYTSIIMGDINNLKSDYNNIVIAYNANVDSYNNFRIFVTSI